MGNYDGSVGRIVSQQTAMEERLSKIEEVLFRT